MGKKARISIRVNPDVDPKTHPYISTGLKENKFGISYDQAEDVYLKANDLPGIQIIGVSCHIGSQMTDTGPIRDSVARLIKLLDRLKGHGLTLTHLDLGGGLGINYDSEEPPEPYEYAEAIKDALNGYDISLILEPGRVIVGNAGILLTQVLYTKGGEGEGQKNFVIVDAGMNDLIRPSLYGSFHAIQPVIKTGRGTRKLDIVGPICESGDFMAKDRELPDFEPGELMAVMSAGAYSFVMSSNYNSRPRPAEVLVYGDEYFIIRQREEYNDLIRGERIPDFLA